MEVNNIRAALQIENTERIKSEWKKSGFYNGSTDFYNFMATPSPERELFVRNLNMRNEFHGAVVISII